MRTCVVFAVSVFDEAKLYVLREYLQTFQTHFSDAFFYVGINYGSLLTLETEIKASGLPCKIVRLEDSRLYTGSDASATQLALKLLKENTSYDIYWFAHTKGAVNEKDQTRRMYLSQMFTQRMSIEKLFLQNPNLGSWGYQGNSVSAAGIQWRDYNVDSLVPICRNLKVLPFNFTHVNWSYIDTMYILKKEPVESYLNALPNEFFTCRLDPWYMETVLPWVPSRCGYFPYVKIKRDFFNQCELTDITKQWIAENELSHLLPYLSL